MGDPLAIAMQQTFQAFRVRLIAGDGYEDGAGTYSINVLLASPEWRATVLAQDAFAQAEGLPPFGSAGT